MGFFSYLCAKTGLPVMAGEVAGSADAHMSCVVVLRPNGDRITGRYDGYGRLDGMQVSGEMDFGSKMVLQKFYRNEAHAELGSSEHDPGQGYFHDWDFVRAAFGLVDAGMQGDLEAHVLGRHQWALRWREKQRLVSAMYEHLSGLWGVDTYVMTSLLQAFDRDMDIGSSGWQLRSKELMPRLPGDLPAHSLFRILPQASALKAAGGVLELLERIAREEVMRAWRDNRSARKPIMERLLEDPMSQDAWLDLPILDKTDPANENFSPRQRAR